MSDSSDFTFLPPLDKVGGVQRLQQPQHISARKSQINLHFSNASSTTTSNDNNPIDQIQVFTFMYIYFFFML